MAGKIIIDTDTRLGEPSSNLYDIQVCCRSEKHGGVRATYYADDDCPMCTYVVTLGDKVKELEEALDTNTKFTELYQLQRDDAQRKLAALEADTAEYLV